MRFEGTITHEGRFWLAEIPLLDALTQGRTRKEALEMVPDWLETMINRPGFTAEVHPRGKAEFEVSGSDAAAMTALDIKDASAFDEGTLRTAVLAAIAANTKAVAEFKAGKTAAANSLIGNVMKSNKGAPNDVVRRLLMEELAKA